MSHFNIDSLNKVKRIYARWHNFNRCNPSKSDKNFILKQNEDKWIQNIQISKHSIAKLLHEIVEKKQFCLFVFPLIGLRYRNLHSN